MRCGAARCGAVRCGVVRRGTVRHGTVRRGSSRICFVSYFNFEHGILVYFINRGDLLIEGSGYLK